MMIYYSSTRNKLMKVEDMHIEHLTNALDRGTREQTLNPALHRAMIAEYIRRTREERHPKPEVGNPKRLRKYRLIAIKYLKTHETISADVLRRLIVDRGLTPHGPTLSRVFRSKDFVQAGYRRSKWQGARGRYINRWELANVVA